MTEEQEKQRVLMQSSDGEWLYEDELPFGITVQNFDAGHPFEDISEGLFKKRLFTFEEVYEMTRVDPDWLWREVKTGRLDILISGAAIRRLQALIRTEC